MKKTLFIILIAVISSPILDGHTACSIDSSLSPELAKYVRDMDAKIASLKQNVGSNCGRGAVKSINKGIELTDRALLQIPLLGDVVSDFEYNIVMTMRGESRGAVKKNGEIFPRIQTKLVQTANSLANNCNLTDEKQAIITELIKTNHILESTYKTVSTGGKEKGKESLSSEYSKAYDEIVNLYNPSATASCKNEFDYDTKISEALASFSKGTFGIENAYDDWYKAIDLFAGKSRNSLYKDTARKLLVQELSRQGLSKNAKDIIVSNFDCTKSQETGDSSVEDKVKAIADCKKFPIAGLDGLKKEMVRNLNKSPNTEVYIAQKMKKSKIIDNMTTVESLYARYSGEVEMNKQLARDENALTNLVNLHISLLSINKILEIRIPVMQKNCMKALPDIVGGCRKEG